MLNPAKAWIKISIQGVR